MTARRSCASPKSIQSTPALASPTEPHEYSALAVLTRTKEPDPDRPGRELRHYAVRHLERFAPGTPYPDMFAGVAEVFDFPCSERPHLAVDQTAVGRPIVDLLRRVRTGTVVRPVILGAGHETVFGVAGAIRVPKSELVSTLKLLLQTRRLKVAATLPRRDLLVRELSNFRSKVTVATTEDAVAWREGRNDDLVLAVAIAAWLSEHATKEVWIR